MKTSGEYDMFDLLMLIVSERAEGLTVRSGQPPAVRLLGQTHVIEGPIVSADHATALLRRLTDTRHVRELHESGKTEFFYTFRESSRFRVDATRKDDDVQFEIHTIPS